MNTLFNSALRQSNSIRKDLDALAEAPPSSSPALQGQLQASLTSFSRTLDEYANLARQEPVPAKQEKAHERLANFRADLATFREQLAAHRAAAESAAATETRAELLGRRPHAAATPENPYANSSQQQPHYNPWQQRSGTSPYGTGPADSAREAHAMREQGFMGQANAQLDEFLDRGRAVLADLGQQREVLKGTQRRLYGVANTLGISGDTIRMVERRAKEDKWIFWSGVVVFVVFVWLVLHFLR